MFFAHPTVRRAVLSTPRQVVAQADAALARLIYSARQTASAQAARGFTSSTSDNGHTTLRIDVPGVAREHLQLRIENQCVHLSSTEGSPRHVQRSWELPQPINASASSATLEHGVLTLTLAPVPPVDRTVTLPIQ